MILSQLSYKRTSLFSPFFVILIVFLFLLPNVVHADTTEKICKKYSVPVTIPNDPVTYRVAGWLCSKGSLQNKTVQVLQSGSTYNHNYWDIPYQSEKYSYVDYMVDAGYATFNMDRIAQGASDHPTNPSEVTIQTIARTTHQIIQQLRHGQIGGVGFKHIVLVGHSMGGDMVIQEAGTYHDVDGVIVSGYLHYTTNITLPIVQQYYVQANLQPKFANLSDEYTTTKVNSRNIYYYLPAADPGMFAVDEATKDVVTNATTTSFLNDLSSHTSNNITAPVLVALGQYDVFNCGDASPAPQCTDAGIKQYESAYYSASACPVYKVFPNTGHVLNLQKPARDWFAYALNWINNKVGKQSNMYVDNGCRDN